MVAPWPGVLALCVIFVILGVALIELGRRGMARRIDYVFGGYTRDNTGADAFDEAHAIVGKKMLIAGALYLVAAVLVLIRWNSTWIASVVIASALLTTALLIFAITQAVKVLGIAHTERRTSKAG